MKPHQRYRVVFDAGGQKDREMVATFREEVALAYHFDLRPFAGTTVIRKRDVRQIWETDRKIELPHIYRGEVRVL